MANYANAEGRAAFPSVLRLARDTGLSERAVQIHLRKLESALLIRRGSPEIVAAHIKRADRRPITYDLLISRGAQDSPRSVTGCTPRQNGVNMTTSRGERHAPDPPSYPPVNKKTVYVETFEERARQYEASMRNLKQQKKV